MYNTYKEYLELVEAYAPTFMLVFDVHDTQNVWPFEDLAELNDAYHEKLEGRKEIRNIAAWSTRTREQMPQCDECGNFMDEGYCAEGDYYCSDECLHKHFTDEEWEQACEENEDCYWTEWR